MTTERKPHWSASLEMRAVDGRTRNRWVEQVLESH